jgi:hypothetical protein
VNIWYSSVIDDGLLRQRLLWPLVRKVDVTEAAMAEVPPDSPAASLQAVSARAFQE